MIEVVSATRCIACDRCIEACPTNVFDRGADGIPVIARQSDCQTCFMCEAYCPADALFVAPPTAPLAAGDPLRDENHLVATELIGSYRRGIGWGHGRTPGARLALGPGLAAAPVPAPPATAAEPGPAGTTDSATLTEGNR